VTTLQCDPVALVLEALGRDQALDARGLGVRLRALLLGLDLTTDDELANLQTDRTSLACVVVSDSALSSEDREAGEEEIE